MTRPWLACCARLGVALFLAACHRAPSGESESTRQAEQTFATVCARCHGPDGRGGGTAPADTAARNFHDSAFQASRSDAQLKQAIRQGKGAMPGFGNLFPDADLDALVAKVRSFDPAKKP